MTTELSRPAAAKPHPRGARRPVAPALDPTLAHLSLPTVRAYRQMLAQEEFAAASWRRLIRVHVAALAGECRSDTLLGGWVHQLHDLDHELIGYRESALERLSLVTDELIARYHEEPSRCLAALPLGREAQGS